MYVWSKHPKDVIFLLNVFCKKFSLNARGGTDSRALIQPRARVRLLLLLKSVLTGSKLQICVL